MSNARSLRRRLAASRQERQARPRFSIRDYPDTPPPALGTVRGWLNKAEAEGKIERKGVRRTGKRGRPAVLWGLTDQAAGDAEDATALLMQEHGVRDRREDGDRP